MSRPPRDALAFLDFVRGECAAASVRLKLEGVAKDRSGDVGSFDHESRLLYAACNHDEWLAVLAHELGHLHQWRERSRVFRAVDLVAPFYSWCAGRRKASPKWVANTVRALARMERDAERRALEMIHDFRLGDVEHYTRGANLYVWKHAVAERVGFWPKFDPVDMRDAILPVMPTKLIEIKQAGDPPSILEGLAKKQ